MGSPIVPQGRQNGVMRKAGWLVGGLVFALWVLAGRDVPLAADLRPAEVQARARAVEDAGPVAGVRLVRVVRRGEDVLFVYRMWTLEGPQERFTLGTVRDGGLQVESGGTWAGLEDEPEVWRMVQEVVGGV